jgi:hypothetical protein
VVSFPVAFFDFGMSEVGIAFCKEKGIYIPLDEVSVSQEIDQVTQEKFVEFSSGFPGEERNAWFKKPFAFLKTPFEKSIWIDLDCEILKPIDELFSYVDDFYQIALTPSPEQDIVLARLLSRIETDEMTYNSGVVVFQNAQVIQKWWQYCHEHQNEFVGDEIFLSKVLYECKVPVKELPFSFNCTVICKDEMAISSVPDELQEIYFPHIRHYMTKLGKEFIRQKFFSTNLIP